MPTSPKLPLTAAERQRLRRIKLRLADIAAVDAADLAARTGWTRERARDLRALAEFQAIRSVGPRFAADLVAMGYYRLDELRDRDGAALLDAHERQRGYWTDPCVEDQFRLAVYVAQTGDYTREWPDFTAERKAFRAAHGYPTDRPAVAWHEALAWAQSPAR